MSKLIFGCGYLGERVARLWRDAGETVYAVTRSEARAAKLQARGLNTIIADVTRPETLGDLPEADTLLFAVGFDRSVGNSIHEVYADGVKNVLAALPSLVKRFIYISTTGVYGPANGEWVDETTKPNPQRDGGKASLAAEHLLQKNPPPFQGGARGGSDSNVVAESSDDSAPHQTSPRKGEELSDAGHITAPCEGEEPMSTTILRLAGIYGPDRIPYLAKLRAGEPIAAPSEGWLNLIHVDDAARIVLASETQTTARPLQPTTPEAAAEVLCVSDGNPVIRGDYYREVARRIGAAEPNFIAPDSSSPAAARAASDKRISNSKLVEQLNFQFAYPSYREGLAAIL